MPAYQTKLRDEALPYYYGLNYDAPDEPPMEPQQVGRALGGAFMREAVGVDNGLWYEKITGTPMGGGINRIPIRQPYPSELSYFQKNLEVAGMAAEDNQVILNPYSGLGKEQQDAVVLNERARVWMRRHGAPDFGLTDTQRRNFLGYSNDENDIKSTIAARILSGDSSAGDVTDEQKEWVENNLRRFLDQPPIRNFMVDFGGATRPGSSGYDSEAGYTSYHTMPEAAGMLADSMVGDELRAAERVGATLRGKSPYTVDEINDPRTVAIKQAQDVLEALSLYAGPGVLAGRPGATTLGVFAGKQAKEAPRNMQRVAEVALAAGKSPDEVWKHTGWRLAQDNKWRFEIDDSKMALGARFADVPEIKDAIVRRGGEYLGDVIDHPELFKQYPELTNVRVKTHYRDTDGSTGVFDDKTMTISLAHDMTPEAAKDTLIHEIQHWVQKKEGFARGGNTETIARELNLKIDAEMAAIQHHEDMIAKYGEEKWSKVSGVNKEILAKDKQRLDDLINQSIEHQATGSGYSRLHGEIEARDAAGRRTWDAEMRREVPPTTREDAIIRFGDSGTQAQVDKQVFYHGTTKDFDEFDLSAPKTTLGGLSKYGVFVSPDPKVASRYALDFGPDGANVRPVVLDTQKTLQLNATEFTKLQSLTSKFDSKRSFSEFDTVDLDIIFEKHGLKFKDGVHPIKQIKDAGFDSIAKDAGRYGISEAEVIIFDPKKVKPALSSNLRKHFSKMDVEEIERELLK